MKSICVVTGGGSGMGFETAVYWERHGISFWWDVR